MTKPRMSRLYGRIAEVENILTHAVIIDETEEETAGRVGLGCTVKVLDKEFGETEVYTIVGSQEADPMMGKISDDSPFGRALVGASEGDTVSVEAPVGTLYYEILSVQR